MDAEFAHELLNELGLSLEKLETQQGALMQFLKDKGIASDEQLAPYLKQAGDAADVRWRAARVRLERLISKAAEKEEQAAKPPETQRAAAQAAPKKKEEDTAQKPDKATAQPASEVQTSKAPEPDDREPKKEKTTEIPEKKSAGAPDAALSAVAGTNINSGHQDGSENRALASEEPKKESAA